MYSTYLVSCIYIYIDIVKGSFVEEAPSYGKLTSEIMKSHSHWPKDHCVQLACASRDHEVTFSLAQRSLCPVGMCLKRS